MKLIITVEEIKGRCPTYKVGDRVVLDNGFKFNLEETTACCMHGLGPIMPFYCALAKGIPPGKMGLNDKDNPDNENRDSLTSSSKASNRSITIRL